MKKLWSAALFCMMLLCMSGCAGKKEPITLTIWHVYGGQTDSPLNNLIEEFNETVGKEEKISVQVSMVSNTNTIHEAVLAAANQDPGAAELPDMFVSYPKTVLAMPDDQVLVDYRDYFTEEELEAFVPEFLEEGVVHDRLVNLPVGKSTEIMFVDKTLFDRFAAATGATLEQLGTWEGVFQMAEDYYRWTDEQTPEVEEDGKSFFVHDYHFNYFQVGMQSLGAEFFQDNQLAFGDVMKRVWDPYGKAAVSGGVWLQSGYATEPLRTGDAVVSVASSASVLYYEDVVTYPDNVSEPIEFVALPVPVFEGGEKLVMQRGAGVCMTKSTPEREKAAALFLKWLTEPEKNVEFVTSLGYMPVTQEAFAYLPEKIETLEDPKYRSLYEAYIDTQKEFQFYHAPQIDTYLDLETRFEKNVRTQLQQARNAYLEGLSDEGLQKTVEEQSDACYLQFQEMMQ